MALSSKPELDFQASRDEEFKKLVTDLQKKFHDKNIKNADAFLTMNETLEEAWGDIERKFHRIKAKLKYSERHLDQESLLDDEEDMAIYSVLFLMFTRTWLKTFKPKPEGASSR